MKKALFLFILSTTFNSNLTAQKSPEGIYLSADDFRKGLISFSSISNKKYRLDLNVTVYKPTIRIIIGDSTYRFYKDSIFGYRDKNNMIHRFYSGNIYDVLNPEEPILIYVRGLLGGYKNTQTINSYSFSTAANATIQPLTKWNLKNAFPNDPVFHELLDMYFNSDHELIAYDNFYKTYKLNRVFQFSRQLTHKNKE